MKTNHCFTFSFNHELLLKEYKKVSVSYEKHFNTGFYEGEWSGFALRKPASAKVDLFAGNNETDQYTNTKLYNMLPETQSVLDFFPCEKTSVRVLKLTPGSDIKPHSDDGLNYFDGFVRFHIPIQTNPDIEFIVAGETIKMQEGECWFADFNQVHSVANRGKTDRIHLVIDMKVNSWLTELFLREGILEQHEEEPEEMTRYSMKDQVAIIKELLQQDSDEVQNLAKEMIKKYNLASYFKL